MAESKKMSRWRKYQLLAALSGIAYWVALKLRLIAPSSEDRLAFLALFFVLPGLFEILEWLEELLTSHQQALTERLEGIEDQQKGMKSALERTEARVRMLGDTRTAPPEEIKGPARNSESTLDRIEREVSELGAVQAVRLKQIAEQHQCNTAALERIEVEVGALRDEYNEAMSLLNRLESEQKRVCRQQMRDSIVIEAIAAMMPASAAAHLPNDSGSHYRE